MKKAIDTPPCCWAPWARRSPKGPRRRPPAAGTGARWAASRPTTWPRPRPSRRWRFRVSLPKGPRRPARLSNRACARADVCPRTSAAGSISSPRPMPCTRTTRGRRRPLVVLVHGMGLGDEIDPAADVLGHTSARAQALFDNRAGLLGPFGNDTRKRHLRLGRGLGQVVGRDAAHRAPVPAAGGRRLGPFGDRLAHGAQQHGGVSIAFFIGAQKLRHPLLGQVLGIGTSSRGGPVDDELEEPFGPRTQAPKATRVLL